MKYFIGILIFLLTHSGYASGVFIDDKIELLMKYSDFTEKSLEASVKIYTAAQNCLTESKDKEIKIKLWNEQKQQWLNKNISCGKLVTKYWINPLQKYFNAFRESYSVSQKTISKDDQKAILSKLFTRQNVPITDIAHTEVEKDFSLLVYKYFKIDTDILKLSSFNQKNITNEFARSIAAMCNNYLDSNEFKILSIRLQMRYTTENYKKIANVLNCKHLQFNDTTVKDKSYQSFIIESFSRYTEEFFASRKKTSEENFAQILSKSPFFLYLNNDLVNFLEGWSKDSIHDKSLEKRAIERSHFVLKTMKNGLTNFQKNNYSIRQSYNTVKLQEDLIKKSVTNKYDLFVYQQKMLVKKTETYEDLLRIYNNKLYLEAYLINIDPLSTHIIDSIKSDIDTYFKKIQQEAQSSQLLMTTFTIGQMFIPNKAVVKPFIKVLAYFQRTLSQAQRLFILFSFHMGIYSAHQTLLQASSFITLLDGLDTSIQVSGYESPQAISIISIY